MSNYRDSFCAALLLASGIATDGNAAEGVESFARQTHETPGGGGVQVTPLAAAGGS